MSKSNPLVLMILDGWGYSEEIKYNAIATAHTPQWDQWWETCPHMLLEASGQPVGLPDAQMGNSEVGHMHIGAGRIIPQDFTRINEALNTGNYEKNPAFIDMIEDMKRKNQTIHILGLFSAGGVHSHENHLFAFLNLCAARQFSNVSLHLFLDGRDTSPKSALLSLALLQDLLEVHPVATISSICGRYYAMDRDKRWQRVEPVYRLLTENIAPYSYATAEEAIMEFYEQKIYDEFIPPTRIGTGKVISDGDAIFFFNFRADRSRQLTQAFLDPNFAGFNRIKVPEISHFVTMTQYAKNLPTRSAFPPVVLHNTLGEIVANNGLSQLRIAETEKYAHVTFFLNGGNEQVYPNEDRVLISSPLVATYDIQPEMSAIELTKTLTEAIQSQGYDIIICNFANADMVGHTGDFNATVKAIECLDTCMQMIWNVISPLGGQLLITADHGNAEAMFDESTAQAHTAHTHQPVPLVYVGGGWHFCKTKGSLIDVAPTILTLLGIEPPSEMTGQVLLEKNDGSSN